MLAPASKISVQIDAGQCQKAAQPRGRSLFIPGGFPHSMHVASGEARASSRSLTEVLALYRSAQPRGVSLEESTSCQSSTLHWRASNRLCSRAASSSWIALAQHSEVQRSVLELEPAVMKLVSSSCPHKEQSGASYAWGVLLPGHPRRTLAPYRGSRALRRGLELSAAASRSRKKVLRPGSVFALPQSAAIPSTQSTRLATPLGLMISRPYS
jgi:hypothetical protein